MTTKTLINDGPEDPVNIMPSIPEVAALGLQHVMVMYAGVVTVPLIVGGALGLSKGDIALLINAALLCCGIVSIIQAYGLGPLAGIRLPVMMGTSFTAVAPVISIGINPEYGTTGLFGSILGAGIICFMLAPVISKFIALFPPIVTGTTLLTIGIALLGVATTWVGGGFGNPDFGAPVFLGLAAFVVITILMIVRYATGFVRNLSVLIGLVLGTLVAWALGYVQFEGVAEQPYLDYVRPFHFGWPTFHIVPILTMTIIVLITMIGSVGLYFSLGDILERDITKDEFTRALRSDAASSVIGGIFNTSPCTAYAQNIGLVSLTGARSRYICVSAGLILMSLAFFPKIAAIVASIPSFVLGGAALVMFGLVAGSGVRILSRVDWQNNRYNAFIFAVSLGMGVLPIMSKHIFDQMPAVLSPLLHSGVILTVVTAVILNAFLNGIGDSSDT